MIKKIHCICINDFNFKSQGTIICMNTPSCFKIYFVIFVNIKIPN